MKSGTTLPDVRSLIWCSFTPIVGLLLRCRPTAIFGGIVAEVIDSFNACTWRAWTHVCKEVFKRISPTTANFNPTCPVFVVAGMILVVTSAFHRAPSTVFRCCCPMTSLSMCTLNFASDFSLITTARSGFLVAKLSTGYPLEFATLALTGPNSSPANRFTPLMRSDYEQPTKCLSFQINKAFQHKSNTYRQQT
jgi:hypothetical protein